MSFTVSIVFLAISCAAAGAATTIAALIATYVFHMRRREAEELPERCIQQIGSHIESVLEGYKARVDELRAMMGDSVVWTELHGELDKIMRELSLLYESREEIEKHLIELRTHLRHLQLEVFRDRVEKDIRLMQASLDQIDDEIRARREFLAIARLEVRRAQLLTSNATPIPAARVVAYDEEEDVGDAQTVLCPWSDDPETLGEIYREADRRNPNHPSARRRRNVRVANMRAFAFGRPSSAERLAAVLDGAQTNVQNARRAINEVNHPDRKQGERSNVHALRRRVTE